MSRRRWRQPSRLEVADDHARREAGGLRGRADVASDRRAVDIGHRRSADDRVTRGVAEVDRRRGRGECRRGGRQPAHQQPDGQGRQPPRVPESDHRRHETLHQPPKVCGAQPPKTSRTGADGGGVCRVIGVASAQRPTISNKPPPFWTIHQAAGSPDRSPGHAAGARLGLADRQAGGVDLRLAAVADDERVVLAQPAGVRQSDGQLGADAELAVSEALGEVDVLARVVLAAGGTLDRVDIARVWGSRCPSIRPRSSSPGCTPVTVSVVTRV